MNHPCGMTGLPAVPDESRPRVPSSSVIPDPPQAGNPGGGRSDWLAPIARNTFYTVTHIL